jgi:hypothetical protein
MRLVTRVLTAVLVLSTATLSIADEAPIVGKIKAVDATAQTLTVTSVAKGQTREVVIDVKPGTKIVRFARGSEPGQDGSHGAVRGIGGLETRMDGKRRDAS